MDVVFYLFFFFSLPAGDFLAHTVHLFQLMWVDFCFVFHLVSPFPPVASRWLDAWIKRLFFHGLPLHLLTDCLRGEFEKQISKAQ
jgi:hypothetical protein